MGVSCVFKARSAFFFFLFLSVKRSKHIRVSFFSHFTFPLQIISLSHIARPLVVVVALAYYVSAAVECLVPYSIRPTTRHNNPEKAGKCLSCGIVEFSWLSQVGIVRFSRIATIVSLCAGKRNQRQTSSLDAQTLALWGGRLAGVSF